jgi:hypothetical protein
MSILSEYQNQQTERGLCSTPGEGIENTQDVVNFRGSLGSAQDTSSSSTTAKHLPIAASMGAGSYTGSTQGSSYYTGPTGTSVPGVTIFGVFDMIFAHLFLTASLHKYCESS